MAREPGVYAACVLVVDDNDASRYSTSRILRAAGFDVAEASTGTEALAKVSEQTSLIVLDINLPDIDGFEVCRRLRASPGTSNLPVCYLSASFTETEDVVRGMGTGADSYLTHPADPVVLVATVRTLLFARAAHAETRAADARFRALFALAPNGIAMLTSGLKFSDANPALCALVKRTRDSLVGQPLSVVLAGNQAGALDDLKTALAGNSAWAGNLRLAEQNGFAAETRWQLTADAGTGVHVAIVSDVTAQRRLEAAREQALLAEQTARSEAERSNQLKDEFLATLSHELRNPLNAILGWAEVLKRTTGVPDEVAKAVEAIERNSRLQSHLIADLLDFAGIRFGKMRLEKALIRPDLALKAAVEVVYAQAATRGVRVHFEASSRPDLYIVGDSARLQQIFWNLLSNAIKFTPGGGHVYVSSAEVMGSYQVTVRDTGVGIDPQFLPRLFDRFSQQESGTARSASGLGIGLSIVHHLVDMHGGSISVESAGVGRGARFAVQLPLAEEGAAIDLNAHSLEGVHLVLVEDLQDTRALVSRILTEEGARVREAATAAEALDLIAAERPDVLISDLGMPATDGYQLIRTLRARESLQEPIPAIALTAFMRTEDRSEALEAGFQLHLAKPVNREALIAAVTGLLNPG